MSYGANAPFGNDVARKQIVLISGPSLSPAGEKMMYTFSQESQGEDLANIDKEIAKLNLSDSSGVQLTKKFIRCKSIVLTPESNPKMEIILGAPNWYNDLSDGEAYTFRIGAKTENPFLVKDEGSFQCCDFIKHMETIEQLPPFCWLDVTEEEDKETQNYIQMTKYLLAGGKAPEGGGEPVKMPRLLEEATKQYEMANKETARVLPFEDEDQKTGNVSMRYLLLPETDDWYEVEHRNFMKNRVRIEMKEVAKYCVMLFYLSILEFCLGIVIIGVGSLQLKGGKESVVIASITSGVVMAISSILGFFGSLSAHENFIQRFMVSALLTMSFLTTYLYVEMTFLNETEKEYGTNDLADGAADEGKSGKYAEIVFSLIFAAVALGITFACTYVCTQALDAINDLGTLQDDALVFRYFQVRFTELKRQVEQLASAATGTFRSMTCQDMSPAVKSGANVAQEVYD